MVQTYPHPLIAREGWPFLGLAAAIAATVTLVAGWWWSVPFWLLLIFILQFFRDPPRTVSGNADIVVCPADGRVVAVEKAFDPWLERECLKVSIFMNVFNVHSNRAPVSGEVRQVWYHAGNFLNAALDKASTENERNAVWIRTSAGSDVTCVQVAGLIARRILCYVKSGGSLEKGQRFGFIRFGSRVDTYLPTSSRVRVSIGDKVSASSTILAELQPE
jgi:phosphatidylserine decarboxylase